MKLKQGSSVHSAGVCYNWFWEELYLHLSQFYGASYCCSRSLPSCIRLPTLYGQIDSMSDRANSAYCLRLFWDWVPRAHIKVSIPNRSFVSSNPRFSVDIFMWAIGIQHDHSLILKPDFSINLSHCLFAVHLQRIWDTFKNQSAYTKIIQSACAITSNIFQHITLIISL